MMPEDVASPDSIIQFEPEELRKLKIEAVRLAEQNEVERTFWIRSARRKSA